MDPSPGTLSSTSLQLSDWSELPKHLLDSVLGRLELLGDYLRFSIVCKSWYQVAKLNKSIFAAKESCHPPPMLLINSDKEDTWMVYNVMDNKLLDLQVRVPNTRLCGSSKGWLMFVERNYAVTLINPFLRVRGRKKKQNSTIHLPPLLPPSDIEVFNQKHFDHYVHKAVISADPLLNPNECVVVVITEPLGQLAFIRLGKESSWTYVDGRRRGRGFSDIVLLEDKVYGVQSDNGFLSCEIKSGRESCLKLVARSFETDSWTMNYLVYTIEKDLLLVHRHMKFKGASEHTLSQVSRRMLKFTIYKWISKKRMWIELDTLGDVALFVGDNSSLSVSTSSFQGCLPNSIYFSHDRNYVEKVLRADGPYDFGVYDFGNKRFLTVDTTHISSLAKMSKKPPIWILPAFQL